MLHKNGKRYIYAYMYSLDEYVTKFCHLKER